MMQDDSFVKTPNVLCVCKTWSQSPLFELLDHDQVISYPADQYCHECHVRNASIVTLDLNLKTHKLLSRILLKNF